MIETTVVDSANALARLGPAWCRLAEVAAKTPFQTYQWTSAWWSLVGSGDWRLRLHIVVVSVNGRIGAIAPFMVRERDDEVVLVFATDPWADYLDVLLDPRVMEPSSVHQALGEHLVRGVGTSWCRAVLDEVPPWSHLLRPGALLPARCEDASLCPRLLLDDDEAVEAVTRNREHALKRRRLERMGRFDCLLHSEATAIATRIPTFMAMHLRQWVTRPDRGITFDDADVIRFYTGMVDRLAPAGLLILAELVLDEKSLAFYLGFTYRSTFWGYRTTYDIDARRYSPGHLLHQCLVTLLRGAGFTSFDLMRGNYRYKRSYANCLLVNRRLVVGPEAR